LEEAVDLSSDRLLLIIMKMCPDGAEFFHTDGHNEAFRSFANAPKNVEIDTPASKEG
jgi:hypothetical protein